MLPPLLAGHGLSYSQFTYSQTHGQPDLGVFKPCQPITVEVGISVSGGGGGEEADEVVQLYVANHNASVRTPKHQLVSFSRLTFNLAAADARATEAGGGAEAQHQQQNTQKLSFTILPEDHAVLRNPDFAQTVEPGEQQSRKNINRHLFRCRLVFHRLFGRA